MHVGRSPYAFVTFCRYFRRVVSGVSFIDLLDRGWWVLLLTCLLLVLAVYFLARASTTDPGIFLRLPPENTYKWHAISQEIVSAGKTTQLRYCRQTRSDTHARAKNEMGAKAMSLILFVVVCVLQRFAIFIVLLEPCTVKLATIAWRASIIVSIEHKSLRSSNGSFNNRVSRSRCCLSFSLC